MLYREAGQFKTTLRRRPADLPDPAGPDRASRCCSSSPSSSCRCSATPYLFSAILIPFLILALAALGLNILTGYAGQLSLGTGGVHGGRRLRGLQLHAAHPGHAAAARVRAAAALIAALVGILFGLPSLRIKRLLPRGGDARRAVLHRLVPDQGRLVHQLQLVGRRSPRSRCVILGFAFDTPAAEVPARAVDRRA